MGENLNKLVKVGGAYFGVTPGMVKKIEKAIAIVEEDVRDTWPDREDDYAYRQAAKNVIVAYLEKY